MPSISAIRLEAKVAAGVPSADPATKDRRSQPGTMNGTSCSAMTRSSADATNIRSHVSTGGIADWTGDPAVNPYSGR